MELDHNASYRALLARDARFDGRVFFGVRTTGIYCRPICPARTPKRENVKFYPSAAAAQHAGFRPCLRCRPETSPDRGAWNGTSNTISRALAMIDIGGLDQFDVATLADRLGVGERQLRKLFRQHLGVAPIVVAQTRRILLAKQLIHETQLPMTQVAMAAGFGSVRRFNESFQKMFGRAPAELRRSKFLNESLVAPDSVTLRMPYRPPYDWETMLRFLAARAIPGVESVSTGQYMRSISFSGASGTIAVEQDQGDALRATIRFPHVRELPSILARIRRVFDLAADPEQIGAHLGEDPLLSPLVAARPGLRVPGAWDGFELAVRTILEQGSPVVEARRLMGELVRMLGGPLRHDETCSEELTGVFPTPERLAGADLTALDIAPSRAVALSSLSAAVVANPRIFEPHRISKDATLLLRDLSGVDEQTAQYLAMRELGEPDAFLASDASLLRAMIETEGQEVMPAALLARAEKWRPWRAYATAHLRAFVTKDNV